MSRVYHSDPSKSGNGYAEAYSNLGILITATATARAKSTISQEDANTKATQKANELAMQNALHDKEVIDQNTAMDGEIITTCGETNPVLLPTGNLQANQTVTVTNINNNLFDFLESYPPATTSRLSYLTNGTLNYLNNILSLSTINGLVFSYVKTDTFLFIGGWFSTLTYQGNIHNVNGFLVYNLEIDDWVMDNQEINSGLQVVSLDTIPVTTTGICYCLTLDEKKENVYIGGIFNRAGTSSTNQYDSYTSFNISSGKFRETNISDNPGHLIGFLDTNIVSLPVMDLYISQIQSANPYKGYPIITSIQEYNSEIAYLMGCFTVANSPYTNFIGINISDGSFRKSSYNIFNYLINSSCVYNDIMYIGGPFTKINDMKQSYIGKFDLVTEQFLYVEELNEINGLKIIPKIQKSYIAFQLVELNGNVNIYIQGNIIGYGIEPSLTIQTNITSLNITNPDNIYFEKLIFNAENDFYNFYLFYIKGLWLNFSFYYDEENYLLRCYSKNLDNNITTNLFVFNVTNNYIVCISDTIDYSIQTPTDFLLLPSNYTNIKINNYLYSSNISYTVSDDNKLQFNISLCKIILSNILIVKSNENILLYSINMNSEYKLFYNYSMNKWVLKNIIDNLYASYLLIVQLELILKIN